METISLRFTGAIMASCLLGFALTIMPLPEQWANWRPEWLALTLIHWGLLLPRKISLIFAWVVGLLVDAVYGSILGLHAFGFTLVLFMVLRMGPRLWLTVFYISSFWFFCHWAPIS